MKLAFIYPPFHGIKDQPSLKAVADNYGVYPPINLAYVAAVARHNEFEVRLVDANAARLGKKNVLAILRRFSPDAVLFTATTYLFHQTLGWIRFLKEQMDIKVIVGGVHVSLYPKETLQHEEIDYIVLGDCENTLPKLLDAIKHNRPLSKVRNIGYRNKGRAVVTGPGEYSNFIRGVYPARDQLPNERYYSFISQRKNFTGLISTRGCPYQCSYCEQGSKTHYWARDVDDVVNEISECYDRHRVREIDFFDPIFSLDRKRTLRLCNEIRDMKLDLDYAIRTRADRVDDAMLRALRLSGCKRIYYGIESASPVIIKNLNKSISPAAIQSAIKKTKKHGIDTFGYFMLGSPGETRKTMKDTARYSRKLGLDFAQFNNTTAMAGTAMYRKLTDRLGYDFWSRFTMENRQPGWHLPRLGTRLSEHEIEREITRAFRRFYFRPSYIAGRIFRLRSFDELARYTKAALSFL